MSYQERLEDLQHILIDLRSISECNQHTLDRAEKLQKSLDKRIRMLSERMDRICQASQDR